MPIEVENLVIEPLRGDHQVRKFSCGDEPINMYLRAYAKRNTSYGFGKTYVMVLPEEKRVWAYYTIAASVVEIDAMPSKDGCPKQVSVVLLARLGVDDTLKRRGLGEKLVTDALEKSVATSEIIGVHSVVLHAKNAELKNYYEKFGFNSLMDDPLHMHLPIATILDALEET